MMIRDIFLIFLSAFFSSACKSIPAKLHTAADEAPVSVGHLLRAPVRSGKNADLYPESVLSEREGTVEISYEILAEGSYGAEFAAAVIENQGDLDKLYSLLHGRAADAPKIDFKRKKVIAVCAGTFNTGGYGIRLYSAVYTKDGLETVFTISAPSPSQIVTQAFTTPYLIIGIDVSPSVRVSVKIQRGKQEFSLQGD